MFYLETGSVDPAYNLAFEEYVLTHRTKGDYLILWQNDQSVIIGQNQNTLEEINEAFVKTHGIRVVRRQTGGGAVYHDLGNLNYSFITDWNDDADIAIRKFTDAVADALKSLGLRAEASGRNDILIDGRKVSGTAQRILGHRILYHGTLLFDTDPEMIAGALHADPAKFTSKSTKSVRSRVGSIRESLRESRQENTHGNCPDNAHESIGESSREISTEPAGKDLTIREFWSMIREQLIKAADSEAHIEDPNVYISGQIPAYKEKSSITAQWTEHKLPISRSADPEYVGASVFACLTKEELAMVRELKSSKYDTWEWNFGRSPQFSFQNRKRFPGGTIEVRLDIERGMIRDAVIYGDFLSMKPLDELLGKLKGLPYLEEKVREALADIDIGMYLGSITKEELLSVMF